MDFKYNSVKYRLNIIENNYRYPSSDLPKFSIEDNYSNNSTRFETEKKIRSKKIKKKVEFNKNVTVINIQSYKKEMRKDYQDINKDYLDEDISAHNRIKCFECNIF